MSAETDKLQAAIDKLVSALAEVPNLRMMSTQSANLIYSGIANVRMAVLGALNAFIKPPKYIWDDFRVLVWSGYRDMYTGASRSPPSSDNLQESIILQAITEVDAWPHYVWPKMAPYRDAILAAVNAKKPNVTLPDYGFTKAVVNELKEAKRVLVTAGELKQAVPTETAGWINSFWNGLDAIGNGLGATLGKVIDLGRGAYNAVAFLAKNWLPIVAIGGFLIYQRRKQ